MAADQGSPQPSKALRGYLFVLGAATAWGTLGLFYTRINTLFAVPPETIVFFRACFALILLLVSLGLFRRDWLRVQRRDLPLLIAHGTLGIAVFYLVYVYAVHLTGTSVAVVLMYTAPVWVTLYAWRFLGEGVSRAKVLALLGALLGAILVAQAYDPRLLRLNEPGLALGMGAGVCYAFYSIFSKYAVRRYSPWTVLTYGLLFAVPILALAQRPAEVIHVLRTPQALLWLGVLAIGPTLSGGVLFAAGLAYLPASVASIVVAFEPVVASALAFFFLGERLAPGQILGALTIVASIVLLGRADWAKH